MNIGVTMSELLTIKEAMASAHVSRSTIRAWVRTQRIDVIRVPHHHPRIVATSLPSPAPVSGATPMCASMALTMRESMRSWIRLSCLLRSIDKLMEAAARMDAAILREDEDGTRVGIPPNTRDRGELFSAQLSRLEARMDREMSRLTVERGRIDLLLRQQRDLELAALAVAG
jgi:hypothetical protein